MQTMQQIQLKKVGLYHLRRAGKQELNFISNSYMILLALEVKPICICWCKSEIHLPSKFKIWFQEIN